MDSQRDRGRYNVRVKISAVDVNACKCVSDAIKHAIGEYGGLVKGPAFLPTFRGNFACPGGSGMDERMLKNVKIFRWIIEGHNLPKEFFEKIKTMCLPTHVRLAVKQKCSKWGNMP